VHDPGGNSLNTKEGSTHDDGDGISTSSSDIDASCAADTHHNFDRDKAIFTVSDVGPFHSPDFV
jgi:hypothetical protein